jgi:hypothetical protein
MVRLDWDIVSKFNKIYGLEYGKPLADRGDTDCLETLRIQHTEHIA